MEFHRRTVIGATERNCLTIASGVVVIENDKVLLYKRDGQSPFGFPGGKHHDDETLQETAKREALEEVGMQVELIGEPILNWAEKTDERGLLTILLVHYYAKRLNDDLMVREIGGEFGWFELDKIPENANLNVREMIQHYLVNVANLGLSY